MPVTSFFTPDRLADYRDLHERFPLWCGDWPEEELANPFITPWLVETRLVEEVESLLTRWHQFTVEASERVTADAAPPPTVLRHEADETVGPEEVEDPPVRALLTAINYVCARWHSGYGPGGSGKPYASPAYRLTDILRGWAIRVSQMIETLDPRAVGILKDPGVCGHHLFMFRQRAISAGPGSAMREGAMERLRGAWAEIGRTVGIVPDLQRGTRTAFTQETLIRLVTETRDLLGAVRGYDPNEGTLNAVRELLPGHLLHDREMQLLEETAKREASGERELGAAGELRARMLDRLDDEHRTRRWAYRLMFPMLREAEIDFALNHLRIRPGEPASVTAACTLLGSTREAPGRLPDPPNTLRGRLPPAGSC